MSTKPNTATIVMDPGEEEVVLAAKRGDEHAFGELVKRYQRKMFAVALRYARVREDAEDIVQQTFQKAFVHLHKFEGKSSFSTWLTRIAINEALMFLRRGRARREMPIDGEETTSSAMEIPDSGPSPEANYLKRESIEALSAAINELTIRLRAAIQLRELADFSTQETARRMGVSVSAVKARVFHGRKKLRKTLQRIGMSPKGVQRRPIAQLTNRTCAALSS